MPALSAFSIVKNAERYDYPVRSALRSALPLCDEMWVNVGRSGDRTPELVRELDDPRVRVLEREWGPNLGAAESVLSRETNWIMSRCTHDWALYIQADEVLHEEDLAAIRRAVEEADSRPEVEGLVFDYLHFYGSPDWKLEGRRAYRREIRIVRRSSGIRSVAGAQGFQVDGRNPRAILSGARIFHYGYAKTTRALQEKWRLSARSAGRDPEEVAPFRFRRPPGLRRFEGTHPAAVREWIDSHAWPFDPEEARPTPLDARELKVRVSDALERVTGHRLFEHRNYELVG